MLTGLSLCISICSRRINSLTRFSLRLLNIFRTTSRHGLILAVLLLLRVFIMSVFICCAISCVIIPVTSLRIWSRANCVHSVKQFLTVLPYVLSVFLGDSAPFYKKIIRSYDMFLMIYFEKSCFFTFTAFYGLIRRREY